MGTMAAQKKYRKTKRGFLMALYVNMRRRVEGKIPRGTHRYSGLPILRKEDFYEWAQTQPKFHQLFEEWEDGGHMRKYVPSIDRVDPSKGYIVSNMRWLTHSENSALGGRNS